MKKVRFRSLWVAFAVITFLVLVATAILVMGIAFVLFRFGYLEGHQGGPLIPVMVLLVLSAMVGAVLILFVGRVLLKPIQQFGAAANEVAKGNFEIKVSERNRIKEVNDMAASFNMMVQELSGIETLRSDFIANVSHEFRTPLAAIEGYVTLLQDHSLPETDKAEYVQMIIGSTRQLSALTENILNLSKLENQEVVIDKKKFRLDEQIRETILLLESKWSEKNIELVVELEDVHFFGSKSLLRQIWQNLLDNAIKFTPANGRVEVHLAVQNQKAVVQIKDSGRGMEAEETKRIFDKFYQSDAARKEVGYGLGLALVKRISDLCGGEVSVESNPGEGSNFIVALEITE